MNQYFLGVTIFSIKNVTAFSPVQPFSFSIPQIFGGLQDRFYSTAFQLLRQMSGRDFSILRAGLVKSQSFDSLFTSFPISKLYTQNSIFIHEQLELFRLSGVVEVK